MRKITILGMGPTASERRIDIAKHCEGTEIWSLNNAYAHYPGLKFDRYFELHRWDYLQEWAKNVPGYFETLAKMECPVYVKQPLPLLDNQLLYPFVKIFLHFNTNYFLGSPSLMLMLALYEHDHGLEISEIRSWGIDTEDSRHKQQRASWAAWTSRAHDRKIKLTGSAMSYIMEDDNDEGLAGVREEYGQRAMNQKKETEDKPCSE
jgi:hypothetical protein